MVPTVDEKFLWKQIECTVITLANHMNVKKYRLLSKRLGSAGLEFIFSISCSVVLEKFETDVKGWYSGIYEKFITEVSEEKYSHHWWGFIKTDFKKLFRLVTEPFEFFSILLYYLSSIKCIFLIFIREF